MILLYHNITEDPLPRNAHHRAPGLPLSFFRQQLDWLNRHRQVVRLSDYLQLTDYGSRTVENLVAITFDDGIATTFSRAYPLLKNWEMPATFFVSTSHLDGGNLLWFSYLNALCFDGAYDKIEVNGQTFPLHSGHQRRQSRRLLGAMARNGGNPKAFSNDLASVYPLSESSLQEYAGMNAEQLAFFRTDYQLECGAHTVNHLFLDKLSADEQQEEIEESKQHLEKLTGRSIRYFAYPNGDYNLSTLEVLERIGFAAAFATDQPRGNFKNGFEITRVGIYSTSFSKFWLKARGLAKPNVGRRIKTMWTDKIPSSLMPDRPLPQK